MASMAFAELYFHSGALPAPKLARFQTLLTQLIGNKTQSLENTLLGPSPTYVAPSMPTGINAQLTIIYFSNPASG